MVSTVVTDEPVKPVESSEQVVLVEEIKPILEEVAVEPVVVVENISFRTTGYCNCKKCCGKWAGGLTASGTVPTAGRTIAVDKSIIPFGTKVILNGVEYIAEDTGSAIEGYDIDIYYDSHEEAWNHGVQYIEGVIVE